MRTQLHHLLEEGAVRFGDRPALSHQEVTLDYASAWDLASRTGAVLSGLGVARGDRVAVYLDKRLETVAAIFGTSVAGRRVRAGQPGAQGLAGGLHPRRLRRAGAGHDAPALGDGCATTPRAAARWRTCCSSTPSRARSPTRTRCGCTPCRPFCATRSSRRPRAAAIDLDMAAILYTSGSTGKPKGVVLSHRNLLVGAESVSELPRQRRRRRHPRRAAAELRRRASASSRRRSRSAPTSCWSTTCSPATSSRLCARHGVTGLTCVPPLWIQLADRDWPAEATASLRYFANTGGRMPQVDARRGCARSSRRPSPYLMYGLTEAFRSTYLDPAEVDRRPDSIGKAIPNAEILVVRPDGSPCEPGRGGRAGPPRRARRAGLLERPGAHRRAVPPGPGSRPTGVHPSWRSGRATASWPTRRASSTSSAATTR